VPGGKALNAARAAHALGADVHAIALLGGHIGRWVADALEDEGVTCDAVAGPGETRICVSVSDGGDLTEFYEPGPELEPEHWAALEAAAARGRRPRELGRRRRLAPARRPADGPARLLRRRPRGRRPRRARRQRRGAPLGLAAGPDFVKINAHEAAELGFQSAERLRDAAGAADAAAITHWAGRAWSSRPPRGTLRADPPRLGSYPVGSGDSGARRLPRRARRRRVVAGGARRAVEAASANAQVPGAGRLG
jgi:hypothetical protein